MKKNLAPIKRGKSATIYAGLINYAELSHSRKNKLEQFKRKQIGLYNKNKNIAPLSQTSKLHLRSSPPIILFIMFFKRERES